MNIEFKKNQRMFICGKTGSGKTEFARKVFQAVSKGIVYDIQHEIKLESLGVVISKFDELKKSKANKMVYQPDDDSIDHFEEFCEWFFYERPNWMLYVEEVEDLAPNMSIKPYYRKILRRGRKYGQGCIQVSQNPGKVDKLTISQSDHIVVFRMFEPNQVEYIAECAGLSKKQVQAIYSMKDYHFFYYQPGKVPEIRNPIEIEENNEV